MTIEGANSTISTSAMGGTGNGGSINVRAPIVTVDENGTIAASTSGAGNGGVITINAGSLLADNATISTNAISGTGNAGDIFVFASSIDPTQMPSVTVQDGGTIMSESAGTGAAGMITIQAEKMTITGMGSTISTDAGALGNAANSRGEINLTGKDLEINQYGLVSATTGGLSPGGTITATVSNEVSLSVYGRMDASSTAASGGGNGGSILIGSNPATAPEDYGLNSPETLDLYDNSVISCDSLNTNGGNIAIHADQVLVVDNSLISTTNPTAQSPRWVATSPSGRGIFFIWITIASSIAMRGRGRAATSRSIPCSPCSTIAASARRVAS